MKTLTLITPLQFRPLPGALATAAVAAILSLASAGSARAEHLVVPLSDPSKPAQLEVSLVMGSIKVVGGATRDVVIEATSRKDEDDDERRSDLPADRVGMRRIPNTSIGLEAEEANNKVEISAESWARAVDLEIQVPAGSSLELSTVNDGDIEVEGITGEIEASNTNGEISVVNVRGPVSASTVNGDVKVAFTSAMAAAPMAFSTLNGDIDVSFPASLKADVRLQSDNGEIYSDFDVAISTETVAGPDEKPKKGRYHIVVSRQMTGKINGGGPEILFKTFNGDILLRRAKG